MFYPINTSYVFDVNFFPLWETGIRFNQRDGYLNYFEEIIIGIKTDGSYLIPIILSCGNGAGDNRALVEDDDSVPIDIHYRLLDWLDHNPKCLWMEQHYSNLIFTLKCWLRNEIEKYHKKNIDED